MLRPLPPRRRVSSTGRIGVAAALGGMTIVLLCAAVVRHTLPNDVVTHPRVVTRVTTWGLETELPPPAPRTALVTPLATGLHAGGTPPLSAAATAASRATDTETGPGTPASSTAAEETAEGVELSEVRRALSDARRAAPDGGRDGELARVRNLVTAYLDPLRLDPAPTTPDVPADLPTPTDGGTHDHGGAQGALYADPTSAASAGDEDDGPGTPDPGLSPDDLKALLKLVKKYQKAKGQKIEGAQRVTEVLLQLTGAQQDLDAAHTLPDHSADLAKTKAKAIAKAQKLIDKHLVLIGKYLNATAQASIEADTYKGLIEEIDPTYFASTAPALPPAWLEASGGQGQVHFDWPDVPEAEAYTLYWDTQPGVSPETATGVPTLQSEYTLSGLADGVTVYGIVTTTVGETESPPGDEAAATTDAPPDPGADAVIDVQPGSLAFQTLQGAEDPPAQVLTVTNAGEGPMAWSAFDGASWLRPTPPSGTLGPGQSAQVSVSAPSGTLGIGSYASFVAIVSSDASNSPYVVPVNLVVDAPPEPPPQIDVGATALSFAAVEGSDPAPQVFGIANAGGQILSWSVSTDAGWLSVSPGSGGLAAGEFATVVVTVETASLPAGNHDANISVLSSDADGSPYVIPVQLSLQAPSASPPEIGLSPLSLGFAAVQGVSPSSQSFTVTNTGGDPLDWSASDDAGWLSLAPTGGVLQPGQSEAVTVSVDSAALALGNYNAAVTLTGAGALNAPQILGVLLSVAPPGQINATFEASRLSGVAPLAVFFDATDTTASSAGRPFHELVYRWDFGDPGSGEWSTNGKSRNADYGPVAAHVFETPGLHTVTLTVSDASGSATHEVEIDVQDPDVVFAGEDTICVSKAGDFSGAPAGARQVTTGSLSEALSHVDTGKRVLLRRGESWSNLLKRELNIPGPGMLGAFGSGAKPRITTSAQFFDLSGEDARLDDWRFVDLDITGPGEKAFDAEGQVRRVLFLRCEMHNMDRGTQATMNIVDYWFNNGSDHDIHDQIAVVDCVKREISTYGALLAGTRLVYMGNDSRGADNMDEHVLRLMYVGKGVISHNRLANGPTGKHELKLHAPSFGSNGLGQGKHTQQVVISDNIFHATRSTWSVVPGPQTGSGADERLRDLLIERNHFIAGPNLQSLLRISGRDTTVRHNIFDLTGGVYCKGVEITPRSIEPDPKDCHVLNNTFYRGDEGIFEAIGVSGSAIDSVVRNNLGSAPDGTHPDTIFDPSGIGTVHSNNLLLDDPGWVSSDPSVPLDYALTSGSAAIGAGLIVPGVLFDYAGQPIPGGGQADVGAFEHGP